MSSETQDQGAPSAEVRAPAAQVQASAGGGRPTGELRRMASPIVEGLGLIIRHSHWPILLLTIGYLFSGLTAVKTDEVALVLRFGRLTGATPAEQVHQPGFLFALPRPIDEVVRVNVKKVHEVELNDLAVNAINATVFEQGEPETLNPELQGYCLTGDDSIVHARIVAQYRISDPVAYALRVSDPESVLSDAVLTSMTQVTGQTPIDYFLSEGIVGLVREVTRRTQVRLDAAGVGLELVKIQISEPTPPYQVLPAFRSVMSTFVDAARFVQEARRYYETEIPWAEAERDNSLREAEAYAVGQLASAHGEADAFSNLLVEYRKNPALTRERLYHEIVVRAFSQVGSKRSVPPPVGERYSDFRITISNRRK